VRVDPDDVDAIAVGIERAQAERDELVRRGLDHVRGFTWLANGRAHLAAWESAR
jgi:aryl carrier-like protein